MQPISVSVNHAAQLIGVGRTKLYELINAGDVAVIKIGRRTLVKTASLRALTEMRETA